MMHEDFRDAGYKVFGLYGADKNGFCLCGNPGCKAVLKHPIASCWQHTPEWSDEQWEVGHQMGQFKTGYGVLAKGLLVVDVDARNGGVKSYEKLLEMVPEISGAGLIVETGSGGGSKHLYFQVDEKSALLFHLDGLNGIDFKSGSSFVVGPGSIHASGNRYEAVVGTPHDITDAPPALLELLKKPDKHRAEHNGVSIDVSEQDIAEMLSFINPDCDHEAWYRIGMAVHHATGGAGFPLWDSWSNGGTKYPGRSALERRWHSFGKSANPVTLGTLMHYAEQAGWESSVTFTPTVQYDEPEPVDGLPFSLEGVDLLRPPGFVGDVCKWINAQCRYPRESLAAGAALVAVGNVAGLRYTDDIDGVTANLFAFCVAGSGCHAAGHKIMMSNGELKRVEDIRVGERLMGPDSKPRRVRALARGREKMVKITPIKGDPFVVNAGHIMHLQKTGGTERINITVKDWMEKSVKFKSKWKIVRSSVDFDVARLPIGAYTVGALLGDGNTTNKIQLTGMDEEVHNRFIFECSASIPGIGFKKHQNQHPNKSWHTVLTMGRTGRKYKKNEAPHLKLFSEIGLYGVGCRDKKIPDAYLRSSRADRLELLAGLVDTDGSNNNCGGYDFISKSQQLAEDIVYLSRSLGLSAVKKECVKKWQNGSGTYYRVSITGDCSMVPVLLERKRQGIRLINKNPLVCGFSCEELPDGDYYGFSLDGDHLYLDGQFIIHHNTGKEAVQQAVAEIHRAAGIHLATHGAIKSEQEVIRNLIRNQAALYVIDEIGIFLQKVSNAQQRGGAAYLDGVIGILMSAYSKADGFMLLTGDTKDDVRRTLMQELAQCKRTVAEFSDDTGSASRRIPQLERALTHIDNGLERPFLSLIGFTTPVTFDGLVTHEQATNGFIGRSLLINERETNPRARRGFRKAVMPDPMRHALAQLYSGGAYDSEAMRVEHYADREKVVTDPQAANMLNKVLDWIEDHAEMHKERTGLEAVVRRGYEIMAKISLILAAPGGIRTAEHVRWAFAMVRRDIEEKTRLAYANENQRAAPDSALMARVLNLIDKDHGETVAVIANRVHKPKAEVEMLLQKMADSSLVKRQEVRHPVNGKTSEKWFGL